MDFKPGDANREEGYLEHPMYEVTVVTPVFASNDLEAEQIVRGIVAAVGFQARALYVIQRTGQIVKVRSPER